MDKEQLSVIINKCKKGDKNAFKHLMQNYSDYVYILAFSLLNNDDEVRDVVQETFIRVWKNIEKYREEIKITTWMYKITTNLCLDILKKQKRNPLLDEVDFEKFNQIISNENISDTINNKQIAEIIAGLSNDLSPKQKMVFVLHDLEGFENEEIEKISGMDRGQIKSNLYYARRQIRNNLIQLGYEMQ